MRGQVRIGISGWTYAPWRGVFYPATLPQRDELTYASRKLGSIEINGTFYALQRPESFMAWRDAVPEGFVLSIKAPRFITHVRRLKDVRAPVANFLASGLLLLRRKLGPILWQLPPSFRFDAPALEEFLRLLPRDMRAASDLARRHDLHLRGRAAFHFEENLPVRHAIEVRNESFNDPRFFTMLKKAGVALVTADTAGKWPRFEEATADFAYARLHGDEELYANGYTTEALREWGRKIRHWSGSGRDVFVYFDNDVKVRAPYDALSLAHQLGLGPRPERPPSRAAARPPVSRSRAPKRAARSASLLAR